MRMNRKRWVLASVGAVFVAVTVFTAGIVVAQSAGGNSQPGEFSKRVADILGLDEQTVDSAMRQARDELRTERIQTKLDELVSAGEMTQEQADEYMEWIESAPDGALRLGRGHRGHHKRGFFK